MKLAVFLLALVALPMAFAQEDGDEPEVFVLTDLGNFFPVEEAEEGPGSFDPNDLSNSTINSLIEILRETGTGNGEAMIDSFGSSNRLVYRNLEGEFVSGYGDDSTFNSLVPYNPVDSLLFNKTSSTFEHAFSAAVDFDDNSGPRYTIPGFSQDYSVNGNVLVKTDSKNNTLIYTDKRTLSGNIDAINQDHPTGKKIIVNGEGRFILKLEPTNGLLRFAGELANGTTVRLVNSPYDLMTLSYDPDLLQRLDAPSRGAFLISNIVDNNELTVVSRSWGTFYTLEHDPYDPVGPSNINVIAGSVPDSIKSAIVEYDQEGYAGWYHGSCCRGVYHIRDTITQITDNVELNLRVDSTGYVKIVGDDEPTEKMNIFDISRPGARLFKTHYNYVSNYDHKIYDSLPVKLIESFNRDFERLLDLNGESQYLVIDSNGGTSTLHGIERPSSKSLTKIYGLDPHTIFRIVGDNSKTLATGMTGLTGTINIKDPSLTQRTFEGIGGYIQLYPNAMVCKFDQGTTIRKNCAFDSFNSEVIRIPTNTIPNTISYSVSAYAKIPVVGNDININNVRLDDSLHISYINGVYDNGDVLYIPIIPTYRTINMDINTVPVSIAFEDLTSNGIRISNTVSNTVETINLVGFTDEISATVGTLGFAIANTDEQMNT